MADGSVGRANPSRYKRVERKPKGVQASLAHHDFNEVDSGGRGALGRSSHGEVLTVVVSAVVGGERLGLELQGARAYDEGSRG